MKHHLIALISSLTLCGHVFAQNLDWEAAKKEAIAATSYMPDSIDALAVSDLDFDAGFGNAGEKIDDFNAGGHTHDTGMRTFYRCQGFPCVPYYYVVGNHFNGTAYDVLVAKTTLDGTPVTNWGNGGKLTVPTSMTIRDVTIDGASGRLYFVGAQSFLTPDQQFSVFCLDLATGASCVGFGNLHGPGGDYQLIDFNLGASNTDVATRVLFDPAGFLYVAGYADSAVGYQIAVAKLSVTDGALVPTFDGDGRATFNFGSIPSGRDVNVFDMALLPPSIVTIGEQLILVGNIKVSATNYQGYLVGIDTANGSLASSVAVNNPDISQSAAVTAVVVLHAGDIAMAGTADTSVAGQPALLLARMHASGVLSFDAGFCGSGICTKALTGAGLGNQWKNTRPSAIAERSNNRDLVIGLTAGTWTYDFVNGTYALSQKQVVQQYGASGMTLHASQEMAFPAVTVGDAAASSAGMLVDSNSVMLTGSRVWSTANDDVDITVTRLLANDTIFADQFGGTSSD
ncbi:MAG: hypothetical protein ABI082_05015 [Dokdonella sp.]